MSSARLIPAALQEIERQTRELSAGGAAGLGGRGFDAGAVRRRRGSGRAKRSRPRPSSASSDSWSADVAEHHAPRFGLRPGRLSCRRPIGYQRAPPPSFSELAGAGRQPARLPRAGSSRPRARGRRARRATPCRGTAPACRSDGASASRMLRGMMVRNTLSPKCMISCALTLRSRGCSAGRTSCAGCPRSRAPDSRRRGSARSCRQQRRQALERVVLALHRDQHAVRGDQRVDRQHVERGRAVDEDDVDTDSRTGSQRVAQPRLAARPCIVSRRTSAAVRSWLPGSSVKPRGSTRHERGRELALAEQHVAACRAAAATCRCRSPWSRCPADRGRSAARGAWSPRARPRGSRRWSSCRRRPSGSRPR